jgi:hypothetical protein
MGVKEMITRFGQNEKGNPNKKLTDAEKTAHIKASRVKPYLGNKTVKDMIEKAENAMENFQLKD